MANVYYVARTWPCLGHVREIQIKTKQQKLNVWGHGLFGTWTHDGHVVTSYELTTVPSDRPFVYYAIKKTFKKSDETRYWNWAFFHNIRIVMHHIQDVFQFNSCQMVYLLQNEISVSILDFQHKTKNWPTQSSFSRVENHDVEIKNYCDGNEMSDLCGTTFCMRWITIITFETDFENPVSVSMRTTIVKELFHEESVINLSHIELLVR